MNELHSSIVTDLIQSGVLSDMKGDDSKIAFLRSLDQIYFQTEAVKCYFIPYLNAKGAIVESIPRVILDPIKKLSI